MNEDQIRRNAIEFAKANKATIAHRIADLEKYPREKEPISAFMAGSPGAGKTEASKRLLIKFLPRSNVIRIDADELRSEIHDYTGANSKLFQGAVSILVDRIHDVVLKQSQSFLLDGTLANFQKSKENIERSLSRNRIVQIYYIYQSPEQAWRFVKQRELVEGRNIPPEMFIDQYFNARENANRLKRNFGKRIHLDVLFKNIDGTNRLYRAGVDQIDSHIPEKFTRKDIEFFIQQSKL